MATADLDLDAKGFEVMEAIYEQGGEATTSEVKEYTGIKKNGIIHYRFDKLEEQGLVTMTVAEEQAEGARMPPKKAVLTEEAGRRIAEGLFSDEEPTIMERMDRLERQFSGVIEEVHNLSDEFRKWQYDPEKDREVDVTEVMEKAERMDRLLEGVEEGDLDRLLSLDSRVDRLEEEDEADPFSDGLPVRGKWLMYSDALPSGGSGIHTLTGLDIIDALRVFDHDLQRLSEAVEEVAGEDGLRVGEYPHKDRTTPDLGSAAPVKMEGEREGEEER